MSTNNEELHKIDVSVQLLKQQVAALELVIKDLITRPEFTPVKMIAYGIATTVLSSVLIALLVKVLIK